MQFSFVSSFLLEAAHRILFLKELPLHVALQSLLVSFLLWQAALRFGSVGLIAVVGNVSVSIG